MDINRDNYEAYFLDFAEGNLSPAQEEILHRFLKFNPDLNEELQSFKILSVTPGEIVFPGKDKLRKEIPGKDDSVSEQNFEMHCIAYLEGDLTQIQRSEFESFLEKNPEMTGVLNTFKFTFIPAENIVYPGKARLKHDRSRIFYLRLLVPLAAAAAIAVLFLIGPENQSTPDQLASNMEPEKKAEEIEVVITGKKPESNTLPATLNLIKTKSGPVPKSDYTTNEQNRKLNNKTESKNENRSSNKLQAIASLDLKQSLVSEIRVNYDQLIPVAVTPPSVDPSSLSLFDLARYQFKKASEVIDEEDVLLWNLASTGIKELNRIAGNEAQLLASRDEQGAISGIQFKSRFLNVTAPISRGGD